MGLCANIVEELLHCSILWIAVCRPLHQTLPPDLEKTNPRPIGDLSVALVSVGHLKRDHTNSATPQHHPIHMKEYMEYILRSFYKATNWNEDNSYENIVATSEGGSLSLC